MRLILLAMISILLALTACQTENDPPVTDPADCKARDIESGLCGS